NNGIAAVKEIRSIRKWAYGHLINAECIRMTDGGSNNYYYANVSLIVDGLAGKHHSKKKFNNNTVGHASENPKSPESLAQSKHKIVFIGPPGSVMSCYCFRAFTTCVKDVDDGLNKANIIGFPIMIEASEVPGSPIFIMRLARDARHLEVQALADQYGNVISLFGRDCSVQRRHQKIIEEAHVTIKKQETFELMERVAVRLTKLVGRVSAGTVEYLYSHEIDFFCFLELNPRLQVEHPTTEMVSGGNIPAQLQIATGIPFHQIRDIRVDVIFPNDIVHELSFRSTNVRGRFSVNYAGGLHEFADFNLVIFSLMVRIVKKSRKNMIVALTELSTRRNFRNTVEYLVKLPETQASKKIPDKMLAVIYGVHYKFTATRSTLDSFTLYLNGSRVQVSVRALTDENDPTQLRSLSPGKLVRFLVESGDHRVEEAVYALRDEYKNNHQIRPANVGQALDKPIHRFWINWRNLEDKVLKAADIESHYGDDDYNYRTTRYDSLKELIDTGFDVFDVLPNIFYQQDNWVGLAALEVYARRAYRWKSQDPSDRSNINNVLNFALRLEDDVIEDEALKNNSNPTFL
ncbi:9180_t:CDS:10, partial [Funneliformis geosporum]